MNASALSSFSQSVDEHHLWGGAWTQALDEFMAWLEQQKLLDMDTKSNITQLQHQLKDKGILVAFVAEYSRGKSELINALFFAQYGRRIMPTGLGRTTMCPAELGWDAAHPPCIRLLPIETRMGEMDLGDWRLHLNLWQIIELHPEDPEQLAREIAAVSQVKKVTVDEAKDLGFWFENSPKQNPIPDLDGLVDVPKWRHASINLPHPLLEKGLVLLDTPGLNAVGVEPELTLALLPRAAAILFILGTDTGVTKSDLDLWQDHLPAVTKIAVLNKIDTVWDELKDEAQVALEIAAQAQNTAYMLGLPVGSVVPVSAQKGLMGKIFDDADLLGRSQIENLERILSTQIVDQRQMLLKQAARSQLLGIQKHLERVLQSRYSLDVEHRAELENLEGQSTSQVKLMMMRVEKEREIFDVVASRLQMVCDQQAKQHARGVAYIGSAQLRSCLRALRQLLSTPGFKTGLRETYNQTFDELMGALTACETAMKDVYQLLSYDANEMNKQHGFSYTVASPPSFQDFKNAIEQIRQDHVKHLSYAVVWKLLNKAYTHRYLRALYARLWTLFEDIKFEMDAWSHGASRAMQSHFKDRLEAYQRRADAITRVNNKSDSVVERLLVIDQRLQVNQRMQTELKAWIDRLLKPDPIPGAE